MTIHFLIIAEIQFKEIISVIDSFILQSIILKIKFNQWQRTEFRNDHLYSVQVGCY